MAEVTRPVGLSQPSGESTDAVGAERFLALAWRRGSWWSTSIASVIAAMLIVDDAEALAIVVAPALLLLGLFASLSADDVACVAVVVDGTVSVHASSSPVSTTRLPTDGGPTDRKGSVAFLVVLNSCCHYHRINPSDDGRGSVVLGQHGLDRVT